TNATLYGPDGRKPGRSSGTRVPSLPCTGLAASPATSTDTIDAPGGSVSLRNGCARFWTVSHTSVSARPSVVTSVVAAARSATAASTPLSANRVTSSASAAGAVALRW